MEPLYVKDMIPSFAGVLVTWVLRGPSSDSICLFTVPCCKVEIGIGIGIGLFFVTFVEFEGSGDIRSDLSRPIN